MVILSLGTWEILGTYDDTDDVNILRASAWEKGGPNNGEGEACIHLLLCTFYDLSSVIYSQESYTAYKAGLQSLQSRLSWCYSYFKAFS